MSRRELREAGGPQGGTTGGYIDSFENMPGAQHQPFGATPPKAFVPSIGLEVSVQLDEPVGGLVCDLLPGLRNEAAIVVKLDAELTATTPDGRRATGSWVVLEPVGSPARWRPEGAASVELWAVLPTSEPWLDEQPGAFIAGDAAYSFTI